MDSRLIAREVRMRHWTEIIRERQDSGQSIRAWCLGNGIVEKTYHYWQRKLRDIACERVAGLQAPGSSELTVPSFTEVKLSGSQILPSVETVTQIRIEIGGAQIITDSAYPADKLSALLRELRC